MAAKKTRAQKSESANAKDPSRAGATGTPATAKRAPKDAPGGAGDEAGTGRGTGAAKGGGAAAAAEQLIAAGDSSEVLALGDRLLDSMDSSATKSARVLDEIVRQKTEVVVPLVDRFVAGLLSNNKRVVQTSADALPAIAKVAPARVAKHLDRLKAAFPKATLPGKDGLVRTFAALCSASVAYQRRLEPVLKLALGEADPKTLIQWTEGVLPALKGEPHANARAVVEERLSGLPKATAQHIADFLGVKLRHHRPR